MKQWIQPSLLGLGGLGLATFIRNWMRSLRFETALFDQRIDPIDPRFRGPVIYIFWHEYIPFMFYLRGHCQISMLVSRHRDAELLSQAASIMGFDLVRGSTRRGAIAALRTLIRKGQGMNLALTPDGPKGPRRQLAPGCLYLSAKLNIPLVPIGLGYDRPWRNGRAWDQFAIPRPWSRACAAVGQPIQIPTKLPKPEIERWRLQIEHLLNQLTAAAERSATSGGPLRGAKPGFRSAPPLAIYRPPVADRMADRMADRNAYQPDRRMPHSQLLKSQAA
ncbi:lysophospholipid acyltransferase family protein [Planctomycetaceae bacterium SH139]